MADNKKPCAPVEAESREYDVTFREIDPLCAALDELCKTALKRVIQNEGESADEVSDKRCCKSIEDSDRS